MRGLSVSWFFLGLGFSLFSTHVPAQVQVSLEPRHHPALSNDHVRLLDVRIPPGDTTQFHIHSTPSIFLMLHQVKTGSEVITEEDHSASPIPHYGPMWFEGFYTSPRVHRVWNSDTVLFHVNDIELPNKNYITIDTPIVHPAFQYIMDEKPVRAYWLIPPAGEDISLSARKADILMILMNEKTEGVAANKKGFLQKGDFLYIPAGEKIRIRNGSSDSVRFLFLELK